MNKKSLEKKVMVRFITPRKNTKQEAENRRVLLLLSFY